MKILSSTRSAGFAPAVRVAKKGVFWTKPTLAAEIESRGWTHDEKLWHGSFKGLRDAADKVAIYGSH